MTELEKLIEERRRLDARIKELRETSIDFENVRYRVVENGNYNDNKYKHRIEIKINNIGGIGINKPYQWRCCAREINEEKLIEKINSIIYELQMIRSELENRLEKGENNETL